MKTVALLLALVVGTLSAHASDYSIQADSYYENKLELSFAFSSYPGTTTFYVPAGQGTVSPSQDSTPQSGSGYWWVDTEYTPSDTEGITVTVTADPTIGLNEIKTVDLLERYHIGCNFQRESGVSTYDVVGTNQAPASVYVTVNVIPDNAGTASPSSGWSVYVPLYGLYVFRSTYTPSPSHVGRVHVKFLADNLGTNDSVVIYSFDQNTEITDFDSSWRTITDGFSADEYNDNEYQVYRIYLHSDRDYDFTLSAADVVGASCLGDGDLEMFNSSGISLWYRDEDSHGGYDASTLGSPFEGWSPATSGYYFLKVSEFFGGSATYTLAYREGGGSSLPLGDAVDAPAMTWTTGGDASWFGQSAVTHDGIDAAQSGNISDSEESWLQTTVTGAGDVSFWWKVSSELTYDSLEFYADGLLLASIDGTVDWQQRSYALGSGSHTLKWRYEKDESLSFGSDSGWLDQVAWTPHAPTDILLSNSTVPENQPAGTAVGTLSTTDSDAGDTFTYTLVTGAGSTDNAFFTITGDQLKTADSFNYEAKSNYSIRVRTTDQGGLWYEKVFGITVTDEDETPVLLGIDWLTGSNVVIQWSSVTNHVYVIDYSTNLLSGFSVLHSNIPATPAINTYTDSVDGVRQKFWRISTEP